MRCKDQEPGLCQSRSAGREGPSMDVQIVSPAILSFEEKRVWSQSKWMTAIGLVLGWLISFVYRLFIYKNTAR